MKKIVLSIFFIILIAIAVGITQLVAVKNSPKFISEITMPNIIPEKPLTKYSIDSLSQTPVVPSTVEIGELISETDTISSYIFYFETNGKKVSGQITLPKTEGSYPAIVMFRGYVNPDGYKTGDGTRRAGEYLADKGFITLAPDFLGYGQSDPPSLDIFEQRFQTYTSTLTLLSSLDSINKILVEKSIHSTIQVENVGIWAHSNGGQIALTVLVTTGKPYPTVLWAPVSKPFPYSILYYTDEYDDYGKALRSDLAGFEKEYNADLFDSIHYLERVTSPIQLHQGSTDEEVPKWWSDELMEKFTNLDKEAEYFT